MTDTTDSAAQLKDLYNRIMAARDAAFGAESLGHVAQGQQWRDTAAQLEVQYAALLGTNPDGPQIPAQQSPAPGSAVPD
jgi:hypothetical protein